MNVMVYGSDKVTILSHIVKNQIDSYIRVGAWFLVGDANGTDCAVQRYLAEKGYRRVRVFHSTNGTAISLCLNNLGDWEEVECSDASAMESDKFHKMKYSQMLGKSREALIVSCNNDIEGHFLEEIKKKLPPRCVHIFNVIDTSDDDFEARRSYKVMHELYVSQMRQNRRRHRRSGFVRRLLVRYAYPHF